MKITMACAFPPAALTRVGAPGTVDGVTLFEAADAGPTPALFAAITVKV